MNMQSRRVQSFVLRRTILNTKQWIFHQDGTIQPEIKLTGILNTYSLNPGEDTKGWGTQVYPG